MRRVCVLAAIVAALCPAAAPAVASADWQEVGGPVAESDQPIGYDLKRIGGVLHVAWSEREGANYVVHVARLADDGKSWEQVGPVVNHDPTRDAAVGSLAEGPGDVPWIAWSETGRDGNSQVRVAHLSDDGTGWVEPDPRPYSIVYQPPLWDIEWHHWHQFDDGGEPELVFLGQRPYVSYAHGSGSGEPIFALVRLASDGHSWETVSGIWDADYPIIERHRTPAVIGGVLEIGSANNFGDDADVYRLAADGIWREPGGYINENGWTAYLEDLASLGDTPYALWTARTDDGDRAYVSRRGPDGWHAVTGDAIPAGSLGTSVRGIGGRIWATTTDFDGGLFVSYLADERWLRAGTALRTRPYSRKSVLSAIGGVPYVAHDELDGAAVRLVVSRLDDAPTPVGPDDGEGSGPGTDPRVRTEPVLVPVESGPCGRIFVGTAHGDGMVGTSGRNDVRGMGGNDTIRAFAGDDCLSGGPGNDRLRGGKGADIFRGGGGGDLIWSRDGVGEVVYCGLGRDEVVGDSADELHGCEQASLRP